jgi:UDP-N-acetylmuramate dehydrogenase
LNLKGKPGFEIAVMKIQENFSLLNYNTFGLDCKARWFAEYSSASKLRELIHSPLYRSSRSLFVGRGSNLLFLNDYDGIIVHSSLKKMRVVEHDESSVLLEAGAGVLWDDFVEYAVANDWWGVENLSLIPGEVGAAAVQNIGAYGVELSDVLESVAVLNLSTGQEFSIPVAECSYGYRTSIFKTSAKNQFAILSVRMRLLRHACPVFSYPHLKQEVLKRGDVTLNNIRQTIIDIRSAKLPDHRVLGNAGSFFMNPVVGVVKFNDLLGVYPSMPHYKLDDSFVKIPAAWLIEQCGWKGKVQGRAGVHQHQPLVLVNLGGATGNEIAGLAEAIRLSVQERFGIQLQPEVNYIQ